MELMNEKDWAKVYRAVNFIEKGVCEYADERVYLSTETLCKAAQTLKGRPVVVDHVRGITPDNMQEYAVGYVTEVDCSMEGQTALDCKFVVFDDSGKKVIADGYSVSCAYKPVAFGPGGTWHNVPYDREIVDLEFTHLALVQNPRYEDAKVYENAKDKDGNEGRWITVKGTHVFIKEGQSVEDAIDKKFKDSEGHEAKRTSKIHQDIHDRYEALREETERQKKALEGKYAKEDADFDIKQLKKDIDEAQSFGYEEIEDIAEFLGLDEDEVRETLSPTEKKSDFKFKTSKEYKSKKHPDGIVFDLVGEEELIKGFEDASKGQTISKELEDKLSKGMQKYQNLPGWSDKFEQMWDEIDDYRDQWKDAQKQSSTAESSAAHKLQVKIDDLKSQEQEILKQYWEATEGSAKRDELQYKLDAIKDERLRLEDQVEGKTKTSFDHEGFKKFVEGNKKKASPKGEDYFDAKTTGMSMYDDVLNDPYYAESKQRFPKIVQMSPDEYIETVSKGFNDAYKKYGNEQYVKSVEQLIESRKDEALGKLREKFGKTKLDMPMISYETQGDGSIDMGAQEGLHRAILAKEAGIGQMPVAIFSTARYGEKISNDILKANLGKLTEKFNKEKHNSKEDTMNVEEFFNKMGEIIEEKFNACKGKMNEAEEDDDDKFEMDGETYSKKELVNAFKEKKNAEEEDSKGDEEEEKQNSGDEFFNAMEERMKQQPDAGDKIEVYTQSKGLERGKKIYGK